MYLEEVLPDFRKGAKIRSVFWRKGQYLRYDAKTRDIIDEEGVTYEITGSHLSSNLWEFYKEPEPDWNYIVKNKCLCWFWDDDEKVKKIGLLARLINKDRYRFERDGYNGEVSVPYINCCPVCKDEVIFYEDIKK